MLKKIVRSCKSLIASLYWLTTVGQWGINGVFNALYTGQSRSETFRKIYREVFGPEFAEEADATGFLTMTDLRNIAQHLGVGPGDTFVDLACGRGGASLWIARETGASLVGIDISKVAIADAEAMISKFGLNGRAQFQVGDIGATGFPKATFDGAMSIDALFMVPDKIGAMREAAHILKPGARFAFTTWEVDEPMRVRDYRPLLEQFGFQVEIYEEIEGWERRQRAVHERIIADKDKLIAEMGKEAASVWILFSTIELPKLPLMRRIFVVARKI